MTVISLYWVSGRDKMVLESIIDLGVGVRFVRLRRRCLFI